MGTLTVIFGILGSIWSAIGTVLKNVPPIIWLCLVCFVVGFCWSGKGCERPRLFPKIERKEKDQSYKVIEAVNGSMIRVQVGLLGRRKKVIPIRGIVAPSIGQDFYKESKENLRIVCGGVLWTEANSIAAYGETGICLQTEQLSRGLAYCNHFAPKDWLKVEAEARKKKIGIWSK